ncbi:MAG TPA: ferritin-like domain-containing protein [Planctomycetota bacterium]
MVVPATSLKLPFEKFFAASERHRWKLEDGIEWGGIRRDLVTDDELMTLRRAALVEGFTPGYAADLVPVFVACPEMSAFFSIQHYEEYKHYHALRRYLTRCGVAIEDAEVCEPRLNRVRYLDPLVAILKFGVSEIFTAIFYREISKQTKEPVLKHLAHLISEDEYRHLSWYNSYLEGYAKVHGVTAEQVTAALGNYQHQGLDAIGDWVEHWNYSGKNYTGREPYLYLAKLLRRIFGRGVDLRSIARQTSVPEAATTFQ